MRKQLLCSTAAIAIAAAICGPVSAADMPTKAAYKAPALPAMYNWSGFYVGGHIGYGSAKFDFNTGVDSGSSGSLIGGGQLGYNWQSGNIVWGLEGDVSAAGMQKGQSSPIEAKVDLLASIRGRLGLAFDRVLVYGTGGGAYVHGKSDANTFGTNLSTNPSNFRGVAGGGIEWAFTNNLIVRAEALDYFGSKSFDIGGDLGNKINNIWVARTGVSYKF